MLRSQPAHDLPGRTLGALLVVFLAVTAPHALRVPGWISAVVVTMVLLRGWTGWRGGRLPASLTLFALAAALTGAVYTQYQSIAGRDAGVALLLVLASVKLLETRVRRDTLMVLYLMYFLMVTHFLFDQSLLTAGYLLATAWGTTSVLLAIGRRGIPHFGRTQCHQSGVLLLQAAPFMVVLFVLFPRLPGPLWGMPEGALSARTGLGDTLAPGALSQLSRSDEVAFRVRFDDTPPAAAQRYWRAVVLAAYDGREWRRVPVDAPAPPAMDLAQPIDYTVTLEPHGHRWLFALDIPARVPERGRLSFFHTLRARKPVREPRRYHARSYRHYRLQPRLSADARRAYTRLPAGYHPRARRLARRWRAAAGNHARVVATALAYFRREPFTYTLSPPALTGDTVDTFLFDTRQGFCGHFASAFAVLMRAAGVPARVVMGYQGAQAAATGDYWIVRQSDAHAWTEVWLRDRGWWRVDPTAAVSPARIEEGMGPAVPTGDPVPLMARSDAGWIGDLRLAWDLVDSAWTRWIVGYGPALQRRFLAGFGLATLESIITALAVALGILLALLTGLALLAGRRDAGSSDPARRAWARAARRLARIGLEQRPGEGPRDYAERVARRCPAVAADIRAIARHYVRLRYYPVPRQSDQVALSAAVRRLRRHRLTCRAVLPETP